MGESPGKAYGRRDSCFGKTKEEMTEFEREFAAVYSEEIVLSPS